MGLTRLFKKLLDPNTQSHWDCVYKGELTTERLRQDSNLGKHLDLFDRRTSILDFGSGPGGNVLLLSSRLRNREFTLLDHSDIALKYAAELLEPEKHRNRFHFCKSLDAITNSSHDMVLCIEVLEHLRDYKIILNNLWDILKPGGLLLLSVPVKGWRDRHREHVNKFTVDKMLRILLDYADSVTIAPRSFSKRSGILSTAYFWLEKPS